MLTARTARPQAARGCGRYVAAVGGDLLLNFPLFYGQATLRVGSVNFCTVDFGGVFFNSFHCVPCMLPDTLVLRYLMFIFCVKAALLANRAFVACFASWYIVIVLVTVHHVLDKAWLAVVLHTVHWCRKSRCCRWSLSERCRLFGN